MNAELQSILIRRKSLVFVAAPTGAGEGYSGRTAGAVGALIAEYGKLGYVMSKELVEELLKNGDSELVSFHKEIIPILQKQVGAYYRFRPMYPNFPEQVVSASDEELYINAIMHYFGAAIGERIMPVYEEEVRFPFCEKTTPKFLGLAATSSSYECYKEILESKASPSVQDKEDIITFLKEGYGYVEPTPTIVCKETLAFVCAMCSKSGLYWDQLKTATDVMRVCVAMNNGDVSLTKIGKIGKFGKFSRAMRRTVLSYLNRMDQNSVQEDMKRFEGMWIRLGEKLHPAEYTNQYSRIAKSFSMLRNGEVKTTNSKIEKLMMSADWKGLLDLLKTRPGDFARRLNAILTKTDDKFAVIEAFKSIADKVSTPVLWQLHGYFKSRDVQLEFRNRIFLPKTPKALVSPNNLVPLAKGYQWGMFQVVEEALFNHYADYNNDELTKVWIDPACKNLLLPQGNRSASTALRQVGRGSRFPLVEGKSTVRLFMYWMDIKGGNNYDGRVDLDLSAVMYDANFKFMGQCSWTNLRSGSKNAAMVHSGDITSAPDGASEFLDINMDKLPKGVAYVACNVYNYTGQKMNELQVGYMGWMEREYAGSGEIYEPASVEGRCDLTADATSSCPLILDVANREIIWADLALTMSGSCYSTESTSDKTIATAELVTRMATCKSTLHELFAMQVVAKGNVITENRDEAAFSFAEDGDVSPYDVAKVCADWL